MNKQPIETARDADLRVSRPALVRAARRAYEIARQTGTAIIVSHDGVIERIQPSAAQSVPAVQESHARYGSDT